MQLELFEQSAYIRRDLLDVSEKFVWVALTVDDLNDFVLFWSQLHIVLKIANDVLELVDLALQLRFANLFF